MNAEAAAGARHHPQPSAAARAANLERGIDSVGTLDLAYDPHRNNFGFLRFVLATMVVWSHSYALAGRNDPIWELSGQIDGGGLAVEGFFVLSGFLVTQSWVQRPEVRAFAIKRSLRLIPALLVATVFGAFVIGPLGTSASFVQYVQSPGPWLHFLGVPFARYLAVPDLFVTNPHPYLLNSPLWSLRYEALCYALVAILGIACGRHLNRMTLLIFLVAWVAYTLLPGSISPFSVYAQTPRLVASFAAGMILFVFRKRVPVNALAAVVVSATLAVTFLTGGIRSTLPWAGAYLLIYLACFRGLHLENFCRYGDFSYGLYIFAYPIQQLLVYHFGPAMPSLSLFTLAYLPALGLAVLSWHFIEAPALALKSTFASGTRPHRLGTDPQTLPDRG